MTPSETLKLLAGETGVEIEHLQQLKQQVVKAVNRVPPEPDIYDVRSIAMLLAEIYLAGENLMRQIAKRLGEDIPTGGAWHQQLLTQFSAEVPDLRPALFSPTTSKSLDGFRRFRHVVHHAYAVQFDWSQVSILLSQANDLLDAMIGDVENFRAFLVQAEEGEE